MKNKLSIISVCMMGLLLSHSSHSSDMRDFEPVAHVSSFKKALVLGLLASSGLADSQEAPYIHPYKEMNMSAYLKTNYDGDMPVGPRATMKYSYTSYPGGGGYAFSDTYCLMQQAKVERALEIRKACNAMYIDAQNPDIPEPERYAMLASAINIEVASHMLEMEAAKFAASVPSSILPGGCAIPTPLV